MYSAGGHTIDLRDVLIAVENGDWDIQCKAMLLIESACNLGLIQEPQILETTNAMRHAYATLKNERKFEQGVYMVTMQTGTNAGLTLINSTTNWGQDRARLEKEGELWIPVVFINLPRIKDKKANQENLNNWLNWSCDQMGAFRTHDPQIFHITRVEEITRWVTLLLQNIKDLHNGKRGVFYIPLVDPEANISPKPPSNFYNYNGNFAPPSNNYAPPQPYNQQQYGPNTNPVMPNYNQQQPYQNNDNRYANGGFFNPTRGQNRHP